MDFSPLVISAAMSQAAQGEGISEDLLRHVALTSLLRVKQRTRGNGKIYICLDHRRPWRKTLWRYYKAGRKKAREGSKVDWELIFHVMDMVRDELAEYFPYPVLKVRGCEADDIIAVLVEHWQQVQAGATDFFSELMGQTENIVIASNDKDYTQLHKYHNVMQYAPLKDRTYHIDNAELALLEHVIRGDVSDGVPNIFSDSDTFINPDKKCKPVFAKKMEVWLRDSAALAALKSENAANWDRNELMIDFRRIPPSIKARVLKALAAEERQQRDSSKLLDYCMKHRLKNLSERVGEF